MTKNRTYCVYILSSLSRVLYTGVTNDLERRLYEHKNHILPGFSDKYNVNRLVYYEEYQYITDAIAREKEIKGWVRKKKVALIEAENPRWADLAADWGLDGDV